MPVPSQYNQGYLSNFDRQRQKGVEFEKYIVRLFNPKAFTLLEWQGDKSVNNIVPISYKRPDLLYCFNGAKKEYLAVECKYRSNLESNKFCLSPNHYNSYMSYLKKAHIKIFIALGTGGTPADPSEIYIVPFFDLHNNRPLYRDKLMQYQHDRNCCFHWDAANHVLL